jgi:transposase InsO family protein
VVDEFTRVPLLVYVARRINAGDVIRLVTELFKEHGVPRHIRSDNGPEFIAKQLRKHLTESGVGALYVEPGSPWQNGLIESFNGRLRDECLDREAFMDLREALVVIEDYRRFYRDERPHSSLDYRTPASFAAHCRGTVGRVGGGVALQNQGKTPHPATLGSAPTPAPAMDLVQ